MKALYTLYSEQVDYALYASLYKVSVFSKHLSSNDILQV